jgi:type IV secretion system protein VirD4
MPSGDARTATEDELKDAAARGRTGKGILFGHYYNSDEDRAPNPIEYKGERHVLVFGPNGSGKAVRFLLPNLLRGLDDQSVIVIDPKGQAAAVTARHRRDLGHNVVILNPFNVLGMESVGFNPLATLDSKSPNFYDDASAIGEALIEIKGNDPHWSESAQGLLVALIMWEKKENGDKATLGNVRKLLTEARRLEIVIDEAGQRRERDTAGLRVTAAKMVADGHDVIASLAARFVATTREIESIKSSADTQTRWMLSEPMRADLEKDGIDFRTLKEKPTTVYVVLPAERLRTHSVWLRLVIVTALRSLYRTGGKRTWMLIDEMAALGHLAPLEDAFGLVRGYRVQIAAILQDLGQLKQLYKERWETFIANAGVVFGFAPNDLTTAEWMSKRSGQTTVSAKGFSENTGLSIGQQPTTSQGTGSSVSQIARPLFLPHDLFGFEEGMGLLWLAGLGNGARFYAPNYWQRADCEGKYDPDPYYTPDQD